MFCYDGLPHWLRIVAFVLSIGMTAILVNRFRKPIKIGRAVLNRLARNHLAAMSAIFLLSMLVNLALSMVAPPYPRVHDEYAYQLASDTYASGQLSNETHPHWKHFETFHVLSKPSYIAKYPPGNGLQLAVGQRFFGNSIVGNWLGLSLGLAVLFWMLTPLLPARWALLGCLLLTIKASILMGWGQTWWSGSVQLLGGALLFGGTFRVVAPGSSLRTIIFNATIVALGASLLSISRPFEGLFCCLVCGGIFVRWIWQLARDRDNLIGKLVALVIPVVIVGAGAIAFQGINNKAVTGSYTTLPYREHSKQYSATPLAIWQPVKEVREYNLPRMEKLYVEWSRKRHIEARSAAGFTFLARVKLNLLTRFFPFVGGFCLLTVPFMMGKRRKWLCFAAVTIGCMLAIQLQLVNSLTFPHYVAPLAGLFYLLLFHGLRCWKLAGRNLKVARWIPTVLVVYSLFNLIAIFVWLPTVAMQPRRFAVQAQLKADEGKDLVLVDYLPDHNVHEEWVYNRADIDSAEIVWVNSLSPTENEALVDYFSGRNVWVCRVGWQKVEISKWDEALTQRQSVEQSDQ